MGQRAANLRPATDRPPAHPENAVLQHLFCGPACRMNSDSVSPRAPVCSQRSQSGGSGRTPVSTLPLPLRRSTRACTVARLFPQPFFSFCSGIRMNDASIVLAKRSTRVEDMMRTQRKTETPEERKDRLFREVQTKKADAIADEAAVDRMIRQNIAQFGP